jgi:hypothetical protein
VLVATVASLTAAPRPADAGPPLRRDLGAYLFFGLRSAGLKNMTVTGACNSGVDCAQPNANSDCGVITHENPNYADGSQIAGDRARFNTGGGIIFQLFSNTPTGLENVFINSPPVEPLSPLPILGDADADGTPSCSIATGSCVIDTGDLAAACGFPVPFPACDPSRPVTITALADCPFGDQSPGNQRCDLPPGVYGSLQAKDFSLVTFTGGTYVFCDFQFGQTTETLADANTVIDVTGDVAISNDSNFGPAAGQNCGQIRVNITGPGAFSFGRQAAINGFFCAPERTMLLGHDNNLTGRFFGNVISADSNNRGFCCASEPEALCSGFDSFVPATASVGATVTLFSTCSLTPVTQVRICGIAAPIVSQADDKLVATVPPGASGACQIQVISPAGTFTGAGTLAVS